MQTIGERLEDARKRKGISIREAAEATKIRGDYLQKFENNQFDIGLSEIYVRGFLRNYAAFVGMPGDRVLADYSSLGRGEMKPRQPSREVYGRMDVSVASAEERPERASAEPAAAAAAETARPSANPLRPRGTTDAGPPSRVDPNLLYKGGLALAGLIGVILIIWLVRSIVSGGAPREAEKPAPAAAATPAMTNPAPGGATDAGITFVAVNPVNVTLKLKDGRIIYQGLLEKDQQVPCPNEEIWVTANSLESLRILHKGQRFSLGVRGSREVRVPPISD
jgi:cytoskeleton protein RodZ